MPSLNTIPTDDSDFDSIDTSYLTNRLIRQERRLQKRRHHSGRSIPAEIAEQRIGDDIFTPSYTTAENERRMLQEALTTFYHERVILDVLAGVKGGKEATVYCCQAHPATGLNLIAAKVYRPRMFRSLRNDAPYKEGREALDDQGKAIRDSRRHRAMIKKTVYGQEVSISSWIEHEYSTLQMLYEAGANVPKPLMRGNNTILMAYYGEVHHPAPTLNGVTLPASTASRYFQQMLDNVELMLAHNRVHADLSAYNILYWQGELTIIDFPQAVHALSNSHAREFLTRDVMRLCQYFERYGVIADYRHIVEDLWHRFWHAQL